MLLNAATAAMRLLPAETAHRTTVNLLAAGGNVLPAASADDPRLALTVAGLAFANPVGLAAGFDKNAEIPDAMLRLGFGFVECGTVTPRAQTGNPRPRLFRLAEDKGVINRMGFNNEGMDRAAARLERRKRRGIVGINIGANKDTPDRSHDYLAAFARLASLADYVTVNVSSPNTPGLRALQERDDLERLLAMLVNERLRLRQARPLFLKIAPDLSLAALDDVAAVAMASGIEGVIVGNTTISRPASLKSKITGEAGGLSGAPLFSLSTEILRQMRARVGGRLVLIGVGGIASGADAYAKIRAGASLVQLYTALTFAGPGLVERIKRELLALLSRDGFAHILEAVGTGTA